MILTILGDHAMYPMLIVREEIVCLIILMFLWVNSQFYQMGKDHASFMRMCTYATGHVLFDIITVLTVNHLDTVPVWINFVFHVIFYLFAILFSQEIFCYVIALCCQKKIQKAVRKVSNVLLLGYVLLLPVLPIDYITGRGTNYSFGMAVFAGYGLAMLFFIGSSVILFVHYRNLEPHVRTALVPMLFVMVTAEVIQIIVPELLFTGGAITIITVGFFFSLENPAAVFRQKLLVDALTGVKSRHSYEIDIQQMEAEYLHNPSTRYGIVFCDINNLKAVNDKLGHLEGDAYIGNVAQILMRDLHRAENIYRMGGDEFMAVYHNVDEAVIRQELELVSRDCEAMSGQLAYRMSIASGYAMSGKDYTTLRQVLKMADYLMYKNKAEMKKPAAFVAEDGGKLNIIGLTDRIFDAFAATGDRNYLTLCNLSTNVSRWSKTAVEYFNLPGEFIYDCTSVLLDYIHPDDRADYWSDISDVLSGNKKYHDIEYRIRNKDGDYVMCTCRGTVLPGKAGEPDMFAATLVNHGIAENIDPVTGLHNEQALTGYLEKLLKEETNAALFAVGIFTFGRINMLYGYANGNHILRQFVAIVNRLLEGKGHIFRMDGTKFFVCLPKAGTKEAIAFYKSLQGAANREIKLGTMTIPLRLACGVFVMDHSVTGDGAAIRNNVIRALELSKNHYHGRLIFYGDPILDDAAGNYQLLSCIHQDAIAERKGFYLEYQPILQMETNRIIGAEALLRWKNERFGKVGPGQFVPYLENDPCFYQLGRWILQKALSEAKEMLRILPDFVINVNITVLQLEDERFVNTVLDTLKETGFPPKQLCLELTERCRELDSDFLRMQIETFHSYGIQIAMDDVGTGFSSLGMLLALPVDEIKLDKSFISDIRRRKINQTFVHALVDAAQIMGFQSCLEGIEDADTYEYLKQYGASSYQGYFFSRPVAAEHIISLLTAQEDGAQTEKRAD